MSDFEVAMHHGYSLADLEADMKVEQEQVWLHL